MEPSTITTIVLILLGIFVLALAAYGYYLLLFTDLPASLATSDRSDAEIEAAVRRMRQAIEEYERERREAL